jgi:hypothetical protein
MVQGGGGGTGKAGDEPLGVGKPEGLAGGAPRAGSRLPGRLAPRAWPGAES